ncbi:MAG: hypothetical protein ACLFVO_05710 [Chloroflexaceae bacterium]
MEITNRDRFWMNCKIAQAWRFVALNLKILHAAEHGKQAHPQHPTTSTDEHVHTPRVAISDVPGR